MRQAGPERLLWLATAFQLTQVTLLTLYHKYICRLKYFYSRGYGIV